MRISISRVAAAISAIVAMFGVGSSALAQEASGQISPVLIRGMMEEVAQVCSRRKPPHRAAYLVGDVDGDGKPDIVLFPSKLDCDGAWHYCGSRGCSVYLFLSSIYRRGDYPQGYTYPDAVRPTLVATGSGPVLRYQGRGETMLWRWNGSDMVAAREHVSGSDGLPDAAWLVGTWLEVDDPFATEATDSCGTHFALTIREDGTYRWDTESGNWTLDGDRLEMTATHVAPYGEEPAPPLPDKPYRAQIRTHGRDFAILETGDDSSFRIVRCR